MTSSGFGLLRYLNLFQCLFFKFWKFCDWLLVCSIVLIWAVCIWIWFALALYGSGYFTFELISLVNLANCVPVFLKRRKLADYVRGQDIIRSGDYPISLKLWILQELWWKIKYSDNSSSSWIFVKRITTYEELNHIMGVPHNSLTLNLHFSCIFLTTLRNLVLVL